MLGRLYLEYPMFLIVEIRRAKKHTDRESIIKLCDLTYPQKDDYVKDVWDKWFSNGEAYVIYKDTHLVCTFNVSVWNRQGWIEGIRVHPDFRRRGIGTAALGYAEEFVRHNNGKILRSLIDVTNTPSLMHAEKRGWNKKEIWGWYLLAPKMLMAKEQSMQPLQTSKRDIHDKKMYVDSWRIYDFDGKQNTIFFKESAATIIPSKYFSGMHLVTVLEASNLDDLARYIHGISTSKIPMKKMCGWSTGIHIASPLSPKLFEDHFEKISSYHLMEKSI